MDAAAAGGQTPLFLACETGRLDCVRVLLGAGADRSRTTAVSPLRHPQHHWVFWPVHLQVLQEILNCTKVVLVPQSVLKYKFHELRSFKVRLEV